MRISDWSSDVCSSDLAAARTPSTDALRLHRCCLPRSVWLSWSGNHRTDTASNACKRKERIAWTSTMAAPHRSEEHTSELQSLMRISYAVFCLKKKKNRDVVQSRQSVHIKKI